ncbi:MAG: hypothetical protein ACRYGP_05370 [Janthinobacterium lividum]
MKNLTALKRTIFRMGIAASSAALLGCAQTQNLAQASIVATPAGAQGDEEDLRTVSKAHLAAVPSPRDIFDFHPAGSKPNTLRDAFIIDPNDGPLAADVRKTAAELKAFNERLATGTAVATKKRCGEDDFAAAKPGCVGHESKAASAASTSPTALR